MGNYPTAAGSGVSEYVTEELIHSGYLPHRGYLPHIHSLLLPATINNNMAALSHDDFFIIDATNDCPKVVSPQKKRPSSAKGRKPKKKESPQPPRPKSASAIRDIQRDGIPGGYEALAQRLKSALAASATPKSPYSVSVVMEDSRHLGSATQRLQERRRHEASGGTRTGEAWEVDLGEFTQPKARRAGSRPGSARRSHTPRTPRHDSGDSYEPPINTATPHTMAQRKVLDMNRWFCLSRPQYKTSCGISSLVSCWNYLFSTLGRGTNPPITQEQALVALGFQPPFGNIKFGPFTGNKTLMRWFTELNRHYGVRGRSFFLYKPQGKNVTHGLDADEALRRLKTGLRGDDIAYIYHCQNHYFCPMGYEDVPLTAANAYSDRLTEEEVETWILVGDPSRKHPGIHCKKWSDISADLNTQNPDYFDIRRLHLGLQQRKTKKTSGNLHCIMAFKRSEWQGTSRGSAVRTEVQEPPVSVWSNHGVADTMSELSYIDETEVDSLDEDD